MKFLQALLQLDKKAFASWFEKKRAVKFTVIGSAILLFVGISLGVYWLSNIFFINLLEYEIYGRLFGQYLLHASFLILLWFGIASSTVATITTHAGNKHSLSFLLTMPIPSWTFVLYNLLRTVITNTLLLFFITLPLSIAWGQTFAAINISCLLTTLLVTLAIAAISATLGILTAYCLLTVPPKLSGFAPLAGFLIFFLGLVGIVSFAFPKNLLFVAGSSSENFLSLFNTLPLNSPYLISRYTVEAFTQGGLHNNLITLSSTVILISIGYLMQLSIFSLATKKSREHANQKNLLLPSQTHLANSHSPLLIKDTLSIVRVPQEIGYTLFLFGLVAFFMVFAQTTNWSRVYASGYFAQAIIFNLAWIAFFTSTLCLRLVFPLMAREGHEGWFLFSLPLKKKQVLRNKTLFALLTGLALAVFWTVFLLTLPLSSLNRSYLIFTSIILTVFTATFHVLMGSIRPDFAQGDRPENTSTTEMGILTLVISTAATVGICYLLYQVLLNKIRYNLALAITLLITGLIILFSYRFARRSLKNYEF